MDSTRDAASLHLLAVGLDNGQVQVWLVVAPAQQQQDREGKVQQLWAAKHGNSMLLLCAGCAGHLLV